MAYNVFCDGTLINGSDVSSALLSPTLDLELNSAGSFTFTLPPDHEAYDDIRLINSEIEVFENDKLIFFGRPSEINIDWYNQKKITCEGALAYMNDVVVRPKVFDGKLISELFTDIITQYNTQVEQRKKFVIGNITITDRYVSTEIDYGIAYSVLQSTCIDSTGGYLFLRKENGVTYIDWLADVPNVNETQKVSFAINLLDIKQDTKVEDICSVVVPLGGEVDGETVTIGPVNDNKDYLVDEDALAEYGQVMKIKQWSDITEPQHLLDKAEEWLEEEQIKKLTIEVDAAEYHYMDESQEAFVLGQKVEVISGPHNLSKLVPITKISISLDDGTKKITLGTPPRKDLTELTNYDNSSNSGDSNGGSGGSGGGGSVKIPVKDVRLKKPGENKFRSVVEAKIAKIDLSDMTFPVEDVLQGGSSLVVNKKAIIPPFPTIPVEDVLYGGSSLVVNKKAIIPPYPTIPVRDVLQGGSSLVVNGNAIIPPFPTIPVRDVLMGGSSLVVNGEAIIPIEPNPEDETTEDLESIKIGDTVYKLKGGGGGGGEQYTCDLLFENDPLPSPTIGTNDVTRTYTLTQSIDDYDAVYVIGYSVYSSSAKTISHSNLVLKPDYYLPITNTVDNPFELNGGHKDTNRRLWFSFPTSTSIQTIANRTESNSEPILYKVYGLKFTSSVTVDYPEIYSEDEREIGVWTDGKPLYQKTIYLGTLTRDTSWHFVNHNISDIDTVVRITGKINNGNSSELYWYDLPIHRANSNNGITIGANETVIQYMNSWLSPNADCSVNLRYTKTTDQPGSGQWLPGGTTAIQYSEKEQIVGQWTDGKTLYQKTFYFASMTKKTYYNGESNVDNAFCIAVSIGTEQTSPSYVSTSSVAGSKSIDCEVNNNVMQFWASSENDLSNVYITMQYTKTADTPAELKQQMLVTQKEFEAFAYKYQNYQYKTMSSYYDNDERVIGRWTDGKPLYQKTWTFDSNVTINTSWSDIPVTKSEYNFERIINVITTDSVGTNNKIMVAIDDTSKTVIRGYACRNSSVTIKHLTMQYTKTTDVAGTGPTPGNIIYLPAMYSEEEREVGVWTDGKPLYQKTKILTGTFNGSMNNISSGLEDVPIDNICYINALGVVSTGVYVNIPHVNRQNSNDNGGFTINPPNYTINLRFTTNWSMNKMIFTYRYTKTTDQPGGTRNFITNNMVSIPDIYSEEEREVGVWTDGKPLYQRSVVQDLTLSSSWQNYISASGIDIVDVEINKLIRNNDQIAPPFQKEGICSWVVRDNYLKMAIQGSLASEGWVLKSATIKYTKTADEPGSGTFWKNATPTGSLVKDVIKNGTSLVNANGIAEIPTGGVEDVKVNHQSILNSQNEVNIDSYEYMWSVTAKSGAYSKGNNVFNFLSDSSNNYLSSIDYDKHISYDRSSSYSKHSNMIYYEKEGERYGEGYYLPPILRVMVQYNDDSYYSSSINYNEAAGSYNHQAVLTFNDFSYIEPYMDDTHDSDKFGGCITGIRMNRYLMYDLPHGKYSTDIREDGVWIDGHKIYTVTYDEVNRLMYNEDFYTLGQIANYIDDPVIIDIRVTCKREGAEGVITKGTSTGAAIEGHFIQEANTTNPWYFSIVNKSGSRKYIGSVTVWFIKSGESVSDDSESS